MIYRPINLAERRARVNAAWEIFEGQEPDISTERLMAMVADATGEDYGDVGWLIADEGVQR